MKVNGRQLQTFMGDTIILTATILVFIRIVYFVGLHWRQVLLFCIGMFLFIGIIRILKRAWHEKSCYLKESVSLSKTIAIIFACLIGSSITYYLNISRGLGPFTASGLVGIAVALVAPKFAPCVYSASFAAMSSQNVLPTIFHSIIAGLIVGIVFIICQPVFNGFGGKLGVIAFFSVLIVFLTIKIEIGGVEIPDLIQDLAMILSCSFGSLITYFLSLKMKLGPVLASSLVTLGGGIFFPAIFPSIGGSLASSLTAGSYAGMSSKEIIPTNLDIGLAGIITGIFLVLGQSVFPGLGGKLGVVAFMGVNCIWAIKY